jgi:hypothetical protein
LSEIDILPFQAKDLVYMRVVFQKAIVIFLVFSRLKIHLDSCAVQVVPEIPDLIESNTAVTQKDDVFDIKYQDVPYRSPFHRIAIAFYAIERRLQFLIHMLSFFSKVE